MPATNSSDAEQRSTRITPPAGATRISARDHEILALLRPGAPVSGEEIAASLGLSRTSIWKNIGHLRDLGYGVSGTPSAGYVLEKVAPALLPTELTAAGVSQDRSISHFDSVASTNDVAKRLASEGAGEGTVVIAEEQSGGRGRRGRRWESPRGGIWASVILRPQLLPAQMPLVTFAAAVAAASACRAELALADPARLTIKWPNDILLGERKLGGILCEMAAQPDGIEWVVIGLGLNVGISPEAIPDEVRGIAATVNPAEMTVSDADRLGAGLRARCLAGFLHGLDRLFEGGLAEDLIDRWRALTSTIGRMIEVESSVLGIDSEAKAPVFAEDVDSSGCLLVRSAEGERFSVGAGDIHHVTFL